MTPLKLAEELNLEIISSGDGQNREIEGIYCGDLLSVVMGKAKENDAWITVIGNINSIAVAVLCDVSCIILSENMNLDEDALIKAKEQNVCVFKSELSSFDISIKVKDALKL